MHITSYAQYNRLVLAVCASDDAANAGGLISSIDTQQSNTLALSPFYAPKRLKF